MTARGSTGPRSTRAVAPTPPEGQVPWEGADARSGVMTRRRLLAGIGGLAGVAALGWVTRGSTGADSDLPVDGGDGLPGAPQDPESDIVSSVGWLVVAGAPTRPSSLPPRLPVVAHHRGGVLVVTTNAEGAHVASVVRLSREGRPAWTRIGGPDPHDGDRPDVRSAPAGALRVGTAGPWSILTPDGWYPLTDPPGARAGRTVAVVADGQTSVVVSASDGDLSLLRVHPRAEAIATPRRWEPLAAPADLVGSAAVTGSADVLLLVGAVRGDSDGVSPAPIRVWRTTGADGFAWSELEALPVGEGARVRPIGAAPPAVLVGDQVMAWTGSTWGPGHVVRDRRGDGEGGVVPFGGWLAVVDDAGEWWRCPIPDGLTLADAAVSANGGQVAVAGVVGDRAVHAGLIGRDDLIARGAPLAGSPLLDQPGADQVSGCESIDTLRRPSDRVVC